MEKLLGERWQEWGTEQCGSNFAVANSPGAFILPNPKYGNFGRHLPDAQRTFLHFIGSDRYEKDYFADLALKMIEEISAKEH